MNSALHIIKASYKDMRNLQNLCKDLYTFYFGNHWRTKGLELYLEEQFGNEKLKNDLTNPSIDYFLIYLNEMSIGFLKINNETSFNGFIDKSISELEKMYISSEYNGKGFGKIALKEVIRIIQKKGKEILILDVLETNIKAIKFYEKLGFKFHGKTRLNYEHFKEEFKGIIHMYLEF